MHSHLAAKAQPLATWRYPTFIAEVASTLNEDLLVQAMLALWEMLTRVGILDSRFFPTPSSVIAELVDLVASGELFIHIGWTLGRVLQNALWDVEDGKTGLDPVQVAIAAAVLTRWG